jgi:hypothetical protein
MKATMSCIQNLHTKAAPLLNKLPGKDIPLIEYDDELVDLEFTVGDVFSALFTIDSSVSVAGVVSVVGGVMTQTYKYFLFSSTFSKLPAAMISSKVLSSNQVVSGGTKKMLLFTGVLLGLGGMTLLAQQMHNKIRKRLCQKVKSYFRITNMIERQSFILSHGSRRCLRFATWELHQQFTEESLSKKRHIVEKQSQFNLFCHSLDYYSNIRNKANELKHNLDRLSI